MYCVIQKIVNKKPNPYGAHKELLVDSYTSTINGVTKTKYSYKYSEERFDRPIKDAYKISIHHSYREGGNVRKRQQVICTMGHYDLIDSNPRDHLNSKTLKSKLEKMGISEEQLWEMVYRKLDPISNLIREKFQKSKEFLTSRKLGNILHRYRVEKNRFLYGSDHYDYCHDIFGELRNPDYLKELIEKQKAERSYYENFNSNYGNDDFFKQYSHLFSGNQGTFTDAEKVMLKTIYRALSQKFHPDITKDDGQIMTLINRLKESWGI